MNKVNKAIDVAKKLIDLPYNKLNLENYSEVLNKDFGPLDFSRTRNTATQLMSGNHPNAGIVSTPYNKGNIYIIGKGILFDSGGYDIKTRDMNEMTNDKAGAIIALTIAKLLPHKVTAVCPITTNFLHTSKIIPGDIIKIGKRDVQVVDTDAEGRLILAEAISQLNASKDSIIITIATLTGAAAYALGKEATPILSPSSKLLSKFSESAYKANEPAWALPLWKHLENKYYKEKPLRNWHKEIKCGTIEAALFLKQFIEYPNNWLHMDIAFSSFGEDNKANGVPIRSLINFIKKL